MTLLNQLKDFVSKHTSKITGGLGKVTTTIDERTGGKYSDKLDKVTHTVEGQLDKLNAEGIDLTDPAVDVTDAAARANTTPVDRAAEAAHAAEDRLGS